MAAYRGIAQIVLGSDSVTGFPSQYLDFGAGRFGDTFVPYAALLRDPARRRRGRAARHPARPLAVRDRRQREAARFSGVRVKRLRLSMFVTTGLLSALTGVFWALHYASARYDNATGLELSVIAAVLLGGIDFDGGKGTSAARSPVCSCSARCRT